MKSKNQKLEKSNVDMEEYSKAAEKEGEVRTLSELEHIYANPDMYMGSLVGSSTTVWTLSQDLVPGRVVTKIPQGLVQLYGEILANACDAMEKTIRNKFHHGPVEIEFDNPYITIRNEGFPILVKKDAQGVWFPEKIITSTKTGTNFGKERRGAGKNGYGLKITWAYSDYLRIVVNDTVNRLNYSQEFHGPYDRKEPIIQELQGEISYVEITFKPNFPLFNYPEDQEEYPEEVEDYYRSYASVCSLACKTPVYFNGDYMDYSNIVNYSNIFFDPELKRKTFYVWPEGTQVTFHDDGSQSADDGLTLPLIELVIVDSGNSKVKQFGVTNSILNQDGGIHVNAVFDEIGPAITSFLNGTSRKNETKGKEKDVKNFFRINTTHLKENLSVIISVRVLNPLFNGQTKSVLESFEQEKPKKRVSKMTLDIPESIIREIIEEFDCIKFLKESIKASILDPLKKLDGKKTSDCGTLYYGKDAPWAGTAKSSKATILFFEGKSAGSYGNELISLMKNGVSSMGSCPTGGKIRNISEITPETVWKLKKNKFFHDFKKMLNVREELDYTDPKNRAQLRYGKILYAGDADVDGIHICSLFMNLINVLYPSLLQAGLVSTYRTKILSAVPVNGKKKLLFYELWQYKEWEKTVDISKWKITYFKGLGSSTKEDVKEDFKEMFVVECVYDEDADYTLNLFFGKDKLLSEKRRELIMNYDPEELPPAIETDEETGTRFEPISSYLANSYISYCSHTLVRHLSSIDGLNQVRRKVVYSSSIYWKDWASEKETRTVVFNGAATELSNYHHGDSLTAVIVRMAQNFVGSNNLNYFIGLGQFGTRDHGGADFASPRYTRIMPNNWWLKLIYNPKDKPLLTHQYDEGIKTEPYFYLPRIPMCLVQGQDAIMCGWRSYIPPYNVLDICNWYLDRIGGKEPFEIEEPVPFFRDFQGRVEVVDTRKLKEYEESLLDDNGEEIVDDEGNVEKVYTTVRSGKYSILTHGIISDIEVNSLTIQELPVGVWTEPFLQSLQKLKSEGKVKNFFKLPGYTIESPLIRVEGIVPKDIKNDPHKIKIKAKDFPLIKSFPLNCMWILGPDKKPKYYKSVTEILEEYYQWRLPFYEKRRHLELEEAKMAMQDAMDKVAYVNAVKDKKLIIIKRKKNDILASIRELGLKEHLYGFTKYYDEETVAKLQEKYELAKEKLERLELTTDQEMMAEEIYELMEEYEKVYGDDRR